MMRSKLRLLNGLALFGASISILGFLLLSTQQNGTNIPVEPGDHWIVLIAHPDDETMFFAPTILNMAQIGAKIHLISVTSGNSEGLGPTRAKELEAAAQSYGIASMDILDQDEQIYADGFDAKPWPIANLSNILLTKFIGSNNSNNSKVLPMPKGVISFDHGGVSGHPNHRDCFRALKLLKKEVINNQQKYVKDHEEMLLLALESVPLWRKYTAFFDVDLLYAQLSKLFLDYEDGQDGQNGQEKQQKYHAIWTDPIRVYRAMLKHESQLRWFRYLYMAFSRYVYINTFVPI